MSEYVGAGEVGRVAADMDVAAREQAAADRTRIETVISGLEAADQQSAQSWGAAQAVFRATMLLAVGIVTTWGEWRQRRGCSDET